MAIPQRGTRFRRARRASGLVACATTLSLAASMLSPSASGQSSTSAVGELVTAVSRAQANVDELNLGLGELQESVNRALVDLHDSQARAEQARLGVEEAKSRVAAAQERVDKLRAELDELTRSQYRGVSTASNLGALGGAGSQRDLLEKSAFLRQRTEEQQSKLAEAEKARAEAANEAAVLSEASELADAAAEEAAQAEAQARELLDANRASLAASTAKRDEAQRALEAAQDALAEERPETVAAPDAQQRGEPVGEQAASEVAPGAEIGGVEHTQEAIDEAPDAPEAEGVEVNAEPESGIVAAPYAGSAGQIEVPPEVIEAVIRKVAEIAPELPVPSAGEVADAVRTALQSTSSINPAALSSQITLPDINAETIAAAAAVIAGVAIVGNAAANHGSFENPFAGSSSQTGELVTAFAGGLQNALGNAGGLAEVLPDVATSESLTRQAQAVIAPSNTSQIETVIARAESAIGTPYVWGGGDANGPTTGVNGGNVAGFDCSGLVLYAFAAAGISLPHYTGYQYQHGTQVPTSEAKRGDLLFWGPGGNQHVAIYLGDGMMIEAPQAGQNVSITPVRWSGMTPNAVRLL